MNKTIYNIDHKDLGKRLLNPKSQRDRQVMMDLAEIARDWIEKGEKQMVNESMPVIWDMNAKYYEGLHAPVGFKANALADFAQKNTFVDVKKYKVKKDDETGKVFVIDNKIKDAVDGQIGDYTNVKKVIKVEYDDIDSNDSIEYASKKSIEYVQDREQVWEQCFTPCIAGMAKFGLYWASAKFNSRVNVPFGNIEFDYYHPLDVLVDPQARKKYFLDARWVIRKIKIPFEEAFEYLRRYKPNLKEADVKPDSDYYSLGNERHNSATGVRDDYFVTLYVIEYKKEETRKTEVHGAMVEEEITRYFKMAYNSSLKILSHTEDAYANVSQGNQWQFEVIPLYNQENTLRQFPNSDIEKLATIQDLINMSETLLLDNAKQRNMLRMIVRASLYENYEEEFIDFVKNGGILPIAEQEIKDAFAPATWQELPSQFYQFMDMMKANFQEHGSQNAILQGSYPRGGDISKPIIDGLQQARGRHFGYKEQNINWFATQLAKRIFRMIATEWTEENFLKVTNKSKDDPKYVPINAILTFADYEALLQRVYPKMELEMAAEKFSERNEVHIIFPRETEYGWMVNKFGRIIRDPEEVKNAESLVLVNMLSFTPKDKIEISITMDWDYDKNKQENELKAIQFFKDGVITAKRMLMNVGDKWRDEADEITDEKKAENEVLMEAEKIQQRGPQFLQAVQQLGEQFDAQEQAKGEGAIQN